MYLGGAYVALLRCKVRISLNAERCKRSKQKEPKFIFIAFPTEKLVLHCRSTCGFFYSTLQITLLCRKKVLLSHCEDHIKTISYENWISLLGFERSKSPESNQKMKCATFSQRFINSCKSDHFSETTISLKF